MQPKRKKPTAICVRCLGSGNLDPVDRGGEKCPDCKGTGRVPIK